MPKERRWYAVRREGPGQYVRVKGQPKNGFGEISQVQGWLVKKGLIVAQETDEGVDYKHWGSKYFTNQEG